MLQIALLNLLFYISHALHREFEKLEGDSFLCVFAWMQNLSPRKSKKKKKVREFLRARDSRLEVNPKKREQQMAAQTLCFLDFVESPGIHFNRKKSKKSKQAIFFFSLFLNSTKAVDSILFSSASIRQR